MGDRVFVVHRGHNSFGRFIKLSVFGSGSRYDILVIPRGWNGRGWLVFAKKLRVLVGSYSSVPWHVHRKVY